MKLTFPLFPQYFKASTGDGRRREADKNRPQYGGERWRGENNRENSFLPLLVKEDEISPTHSPPPILLCCGRSLSVQYALSLSRQRSLTTWLQKMAR